MSNWTIYWLLKLDDIRAFLGGFSSFMGFVGLVGFFGMITLTTFCFSYKDSVEPGETSERMNAQSLYKRLKLFWIMWGIIVLLTLFTSISKTLVPTTKQMAVIYVVPKIVNNEQVQEIPNKVLNIANEWLDKLSPTEKEGD